MSALTAFTVQLLNFFEELCNTFPEEKDIKMATEAIKGAKKINPRLILDLFTEHVYNDLASAVAKQPVVIALEADTSYFQSYSGGILDSTACGNSLDHAVEIVGYGTENGVDYWIVRNSWSDSWGENGYIRIKKSSSTNDVGICGLAKEPSFLSV